MQRGMNDRHAVAQGHQDIGGLDVTVNDAFLMGVLDGVADLHEKIQAGLGGQVVLVAVVGDFEAANQFHDEIRTAIIRRPGVEHFGDVGMVHQGESLALGLEARNDALGTHPQLDDFEGDAAADRLLLLCHVNRPTAAFADLLEQLVTPDAVARAFGDGGNLDGGLVFAVGQKTARRFLGLQEFLDIRPQGRVASTRLVQVGLASCPGRDLRRYVENRPQ